MAYFHVRVTVNLQRADELKLDLDEEALERQFLAPYRRGEAIVMNGKTIPIRDVRRIRISRSDVPSADLIARVKADARNSDVVVVGGTSIAWKAAARGIDVTDEYITLPPGSEAGDSPPPEWSAPAAEDPADAGSHKRTVFVVEGRDTAASDAVKSLLRTLGLEILEWDHAVALTGTPNPYVGDVVAKGLSKADAAVVIITPDDVVHLRSDLVREDDGPDERETRGQARPNVYYEAGIADTLGRDRTVLVEVGKVKSFSDAAGRHVVRYDGSSTKRHTLAERLKLAGLDVNTTGNDWLTAGDVTAAVDAADRSFSQASESATADKLDVARKIKALLDFHAELAGRSEFSDLSDLPTESLTFVVRAQRAIDAYGATSTYSDEAQRVKAQPTHVRVPVLHAILGALLADIEDSA